MNMDALEAQTGKILSVKLYVIFGNLPFAVIAKYSCMKSL